MNDSITKQDGSTIGTSLDSHLSFKLEVNSKSKDKVEKNKNKEHISSKVSLLSSLIRSTKRRYTTT